MTKRIFFFFSLAILSLACSKHEHPKGSKTKHKWTVEATNIHKTLYFTGTIQPLQKFILTSPLDGVVETIYYQYGQFVKKGAEIFKLRSVELQHQYNDTLLHYLEVRDNYRVARIKFNGTKSLWHDGLIAKNNYLSEQSNLRALRVAMIKASEKLTTLLQKTGEATQVKNLTFNNFAKIRSTLSTQHNQIHLLAPADGILLYPVTTEEHKTIVLTIGSAIKADQVTAILGDMRGIRVQIDIPEVDIDKLKPGMRAIVRSIVFPNQPLYGKLVEISSQAVTLNGSSMPFFQGVVAVQQLSSVEQSLIKVGMSATIEVIIDNMDKLIVPISAIKQKNQQAMVQICDATDHKKMLAVTTGTVLDKNVVIESGLHAGDVVIY